MRDPAAFAFSIDISQSALDDLSDRLTRTRWPLAPRAAPWEFGTDLAWMQDLLAWWRDGFDWRAQEAKLNRFGHYRLPAGVGRVHAVIAHAASDARPPMLMLHGWPGSFVEFLGLLEPLAQPDRHGGRAEEAVSVIAASLPGFPLSDAPSGPIGPREAASILHAMMRDTLGIERFVVHGGDWGAAVASWMAFDFPQSVAGIHLTTAIMQPDSPAEITDAERSYLDARRGRGPWEQGYQVIQGTKPLTVAYGLTDSPAGLAAWILEKYQGWTSARLSGSAPGIDRDTLLSVVMLYWLAGPGPSAWMYRFLVDGTAFRLPAGGRIKAPTSLCLFGDDISPAAPLSWQARSYNVVRRTLVPHGGHFPGLDAAPALLADLRAFLAVTR